MDNALKLSDEIFLKFMDDLQKSIKRYSKFNDEIRFLMLIDKIMIFLTAVKSLSFFDMNSKMNDINKNNQLSDTDKSNKLSSIISKYEQMDTIFELVKNEFTALEDYIQKDSKSILNKMENKLDEVLLGPYYRAGMELMENSKNNFKLNIKNQNNKLNIKSDNKYINKNSVANSIDVKYFNGDNNDNDDNDSIDDNDKKKYVRFCDTRDSFDDKQSSNQTDKKVIVDYGNSCF